MQARRVVNENTDLMLALERQRRFIQEADTTHKTQRASLTLTLTLSLLYS